MRCFIAIPIPGNIHSQLSKIQSQLKETDADVKWVGIDNIHLTLKFLGEVDEQKIKAISEKLKEIADKHTCFQTRAEKAGAFPTLSNPKVVWIGLNKNEEKINNLQKEIEGSLHSFGFEKETRLFHPHLTLGRVRSKKNIQKLTEEIKTLSSFQSDCFTADKIVLFKSILKPQGAEYTTLDEFEFLG